MFVRILWTNQAVMVFLSGDVFWMCLSGECLFQRGEVWSGCWVLQQRHGGRQHERPAARQQSHGLPQAGEVSSATFISLARVKRREDKGDKTYICVFSVCCRYEEAEEDCTKAIFLDSTYSKAFARRATARVALGKLQEAKQGAEQHCPPNWKTKKLYSSR